MFVVTVVSGIDHLLLLLYKKNVGIQQDVIVREIRLEWHVIHWKLHIFEGVDKPNWFHKVLRMCMCWAGGLEGFHFVLLIRMSEVDVECSYRLWNLEINLPTWSLIRVK